MARDLQAILVRASNQLKSLKFPAATPRLSPRRGAVGVLWSSTPAAIFSEACHD